MGKNEHIGARVDSDLVDRIDAVSEKYEMDRSKLTRRLIKSGLDIVERDGLDALLELAREEGEAAGGEVTAST